jgi:hypothetical protein
MPGKTLEPEGGAGAQPAQRPRSTTRPATGTPSFASPRRASFPATRRRQRHLAEYEDAVRLDAPIKSGGCTACHQLGTKARARCPKELGTFHSSMEAWDGASSRARRARRWPAA